MTYTFKIVMLVVLFIYSMPAFPQQPTGKAKEVVRLINEARTNPKLFLTKYRIKINKYEPKLISILEKGTTTSKVIWDKAIVENCKQRVYGSLNTEYKGSNKMCGSTTSYGSGLLDDEAIYFLCGSYTHILDEEYAYFGFYSDSKGYTYSWGKSCENKKRYVFEFNKKIDSSKVNFNKLNTAINEREMTKMDKEMIKEINFVRQYPKVYADIIAKDLAEKSKNMGGLSKDEYDAGIELIEELKVMSPAQLLYPKKCVYEAAKKHGEDCKKRGFTDHTGSDSSSPFSRISKYCDNLKGNESIVGVSNSVRDSIILLLLDTGISSRGHRYTTLDPKWKYVGCYGYKGKHWWNYIQNFATD